LAAVISAQNNNSSIEALGQHFGFEMVKSASSIGRIARWRAETNTVRDAGTLRSAFREEVMGDGIKTPATSVTVHIRRLPHGTGLDAPAYHSAQAAGLDLQAATPAEAPMALRPGERALVPTGFAMELPDGYQAEVRPRSGLALNHGVTVLNSPGTIDADYRGEIKVLLINLGQEDFVVTRGQRIAQMVIMPVARAEIAIAAQLAESPRGHGGFGSTG
jgi:dUTP pyrophosphatase